MLNNDKYIKLNHGMKKIPAASMDESEKVRKYIVLMFSAVEINEEKLSQMKKPPAKFGETANTRKTVDLTNQKMLSEFNTIGWDK
jgi:hypothetical protein